MESKRDTPQAPTNPNGSNVDAGGGYSTNESYKREPLKTSSNDYGKSDSRESSDIRRSDRQYQPSYQQPGPRPAAPDGPYSGNTDSQNNSYSSNAYQSPPVGGQPNQGYQNNNTPSYQSSTATINYQPTTASPASSTLPNYQPNNGATSQSALSTSSKPPATQAPYPSSAPSGQPSPYQTPTSQPQFQPSYQQSYQNKQPQQSLPPKKEPPPASMNPPRPAPAAATLQRQTSSLNTSQRPYQPSTSPTRPAVPQTAAPPRTTSYAPTMQNYQPYQSSPATRPPSQTLSSYNTTPTARSPNQRPPTSSDADLYSSNPSYPRSPSYGKDSSRWSDSDSRPTSAAPYTPNLTEKESLMKENPLVSTARPDLKGAMQDKFKTIMRQNTQLDSSSIPPVRVPDGPLPRPLSRKNSEITPQLVKTGSGGFEDLSKVAIPAKNDLLEDGGEDLDDDLDFDDKVPSEVGSPTYVEKTIKFFEQNDKARVPLVPKLPEKKEKPVRPTHIDIVSSISRTEGEEFESGVDESPMMHPNLRSIRDPPKRVARIRSASSGRQWVTPRASYPGTPTRAASTPSRSTPNTPKRNKPSLRFKPEEELLNFFHGSDYEHHNTGKENRPRTNGVPTSPKKTPSKLPSSTRKTPTSTPLKSPSTAMSIPKTPDSPDIPLIKKVPMNKIQVGAAPSPNIKQVKSKIGSLANTTHKPGGGNIKIESHKLNITAQSRIAAKNDTYVPTGGDKKIQHVKLQWNAKSKVGSLGNASHKPGGGDKKIESVKLDFKDKAKPKVGSKDNVQHVPGGGDVKSRNSAGRKSVDIQSQKLEFKAESKVGSLNNVKHKPGGGDVKIFDDKTFMKQVASTQGSGNQSPMHCSVSNKSLSETSQDGS